MITKFIEWDIQTQNYIRQSLVHAINQSGYVINLHTNGKVDEDNIFDAIEMGKVYPSVTREKAISVLESIPDLDSNQSYVIAHVIEYLKTNFMR